MAKNDKGLAAIRAYKRKKSIARMYRLVRRTPKWKDEFKMKDEVIDAYINHMLVALKDDPKAVRAAIEWQKVKKKYSQVDANTAAELDLELLEKIGKKSDKPKPSKD